MQRSAANQQYVDAVAAAGEAPIVIPVGLPDDALRRIYADLDGLLLPGGDDVAPHRYGHEPHPKLGLVDEARDELELTLASWALRDRLPTLGICRGIQVLAVAAGGTLYQDLPSQLESVHLHDVREHGRDHLAHELIVEPTSRLAGILGPGSVLVNTFHHQAVLDIPAGFVITARAPDGVIEAIEGEGPDFVMGIQCHPEGIWQTTAPRFARLFRAFVEAAAERAGAAV
jgi:putative glutamine amidotransferase